MSEFRLPCGNVSSASPRRESLHWVCRSVAGDLEGISEGRGCGGSCSRRRGVSRDFSAASCSPSLGGGESCIRVSVVGVALLLALTGIEGWRPRRAPWAGRSSARCDPGSFRWRRDFGVGARDLRLAQTYVVAVEHQTIQPEGRAAARWSREFLGRGRHIAADRSNGRLLLVHGGQSARIGPDPAFDLVIRLPDMAPWEIALLAQEQIGYVLVDRRFISEDAMVGYYFTTSTSPPIRRLFYHPSFVPQVRSTSADEPSP